MRYRPPGKKSRYWVPPEEFKLAVQWSKCYLIWVKELESMPDPSRGIAYDTEKVQTSNEYDSTAELAIRRDELARKVRLIKDLAKMVTSDLYPWLLKGVTEDYTADQLIAQGMPCGRNLYLRKRQQFYYHLAKRI